MREIKFRVWSSSFMKMYYPHPKADCCVRISGEIEVQVDAGENTGFFIPPSSTLKLMQYTGLKDKNGKEIYEGDIVRRHWKGDKPEDKPIYFDDGSFWWGEGKSGTLISSMWAEVVGNIWADPELMEAVKS